MKKHMLFLSLVVCGSIASCTCDLFCMEIAHEPTKDVYENNTDTIQRVIQLAPEWLCEADPRTGKTLLMLAVQAEHSESVQLLLTAPNVTSLLHDKDKFGNTALMHATVCEHSTMLQLLIDAHIKNNIGLNDQDHTMGWTALMRAAFFGKSELVQLLLKAHADPCMRTNHGDTALTLAAQRQYPDVVNILINTAPESAKCSICFEHGGNFRQLPCGHYFHSVCIRKWFEKAPTCPLCREQEKADEPLVSRPLFRLGNAD